MGKKKKKPNWQLREISTSHGAEGCMVHHGGSVKREQTLKSRDEPVGSGEQPQSGTAIEEILRHRALGPCY